MELYLDSANFREIEEAFELGFLYGLTTTPTFMYRDGIRDVDAAIVKLSEMVPVLQIEALGNRADEIEKEAYRLLDLGLDKEKTVFKIPVSLEGAKACKKLTDDGLQVNIHLVYTVQQAYIAMSAGATYVCPLVGRLQDQGHDALSLIQQCVDAVENYGYNSKIMFSSVRHPEHVRNALNLGAHACTIPWKVLKLLAHNHFTDIGTREFVDHTRMITTRVKDTIRPGITTIDKNAKVIDALMIMTKTKLGAITVLDGNNIYRIFTDGDLRRLLNSGDELAVHKKLEELEPNTPVTIGHNATLSEASDLFKQYHVDNIIVTENNTPIGILDIQDIL